MNIRAWAIICGVLSVFVLTAGHAALAGPSADLFGTQEVRNNNLRPFPKWTGMLERYFADAGAQPGPCTAKVFNKCHAQRWQEMINQLQGQDLTAQLEMVNTFMNKRRYIVDPVNWGLRDYWSTPGQFFAKYGDCEDYAIAKYLTLKRLGVPTARMRIVVLQDLNLGVAHAILAVYTGDGIIILDNQIQRTVQASVIRHYKPIFSINEDAWWLHRPRRGKHG
ncbi:MAG: transglutaminase-like cysteine peptidase [Alphaproteobacteria bacterium]|nr:transglutaminase-like cysteine peptidase [Alphaproteobacteria bacterium]